MTKNRVMLIVRDGWGYSENEKGNAILYASTPFDDYLNEAADTVLLQAHGPSVGLPKGFQGSSEVGHMNMGAGHIVIQEVTRINDLLETGQFYQSEKFKEILTQATYSDNAIHLMGLLQDEGVHAHQNHLFLLLKYFAKAVPNTPVYIHVFADGRDTPPQSCIGFLKQLEEQLSTHGNASIATLTGRYYAMDRSKNWDLITIAYDAICFAKGMIYSNLHDAIRKSYKNDTTPDGQPMCDEYLQPFINSDYNGVNPGDVIINYNYRQDRAIQITKAFTEPGALTQTSFVENLHYFGFTQYFDEFNSYLVDAITSADSSPVLVGKVISDAGLNQLRISETQKFRHVTSFFNGKLTKPFPLEKQVEIPSEFDPSSFATHPEMNANEITQAVMESLDEDYSFILVNYANCDMVGHTGDFEAAVTGAEIVDKNVKMVTEKAISQGYNVLITADHRNSEEMINLNTGEPKTSHTLNPVKLHFLNGENAIYLNENMGILADIGTLILRLLNLPVPNEMTANNIRLKLK